MSLRARFYAVWWDGSEVGWVEDGTGMWEESFPEILNHFFSVAIEAINAALPETLRGFWCLAFKVLLL